MPRFYAVLAGLITLAILCLMMMAALAWDAEAHEWYTNRIDPVTKSGCCGGSDCNKLVIEPGVLTPVADGYLLRLTVEQAQRINRARKTPVETLVPLERIQDSGDGNYHLCIPSARFESMRADFYCFFAPPST